MARSVDPTQLRRWEQKHPHALTDHERRAWCVPAPALVHSDCSRPWQLFHAARAHQHARRVVAAGRRVLSRNFTAMIVPSAVRRYALAVFSCAVRRSPAALRTSPHRRDLPVRPFFRGSAGAIGEPL